MALVPVRLSKLTQSQPIVDAQGRPVSSFLRYFNKALEQIERAFNGIIAAQTAASAAQSTADGAQDSADGAQTTADDALGVANSKLSQADADARYVSQSQTEVWSAASGTADRSAYAAYVSPAISAIPTQAEVQGISDALEDLSQHMVALISDLRANNALSS